VQKVAQLFRLGHEFNLVSAIALRRYSTADGSQAFLPIEK
jgi:hypothetical protein